MASFFQQSLMATRGGVGEPNARNEEWSGLVCINSDNESYLDAYYYICLVVARAV